LKLPKNNENVQIKTNFIQNYSSAKNMKKQLLESNGVLQSFDIKHQ